ncbi:MAG TPA: helix-turn-helix transcriptional regulator [Allosphingosinicella sp.]|nr:helix-turn-helix transcriptional regulator [Allosphingosinicella sp.]
MARAALLWSLHEAASAAGLSYRTILRFEKEQRDVRPELIADLRRAFEAAGVRFIEKEPMPEAPCAGTQHSATR